MKFFFKKITFLDSFILTRLFFGEVGFSIKILYTAQLLFTNLFHFNFILLIKLA